MSKLVSLPLLFAGIFFATPALAQVPSGTVELTTNPTSVILPSGGTNDGGITYNTGDIVYGVSYTLTGTGLSNAIVTLVLPQGVERRDEDTPDGVTTACTGSYQNGPTTCKFTLNLTSGGVSGQLSVMGRLSHGHQLDGATITTTATLDVDYNGGVDSMPQEIDTKNLTVEADAIITTTTHSAINPQWMVNPNPEPGKSDVGLSWQYDIRINNQGNADVDAGWTWTNDIDSRLTFVEWDAADGSPTEVSAPAAWTKGDLVLTGSKLEPFRMSRAFVRVWVSCSDLPLVAGTLVNGLSFSGDESKLAGPHTWTASSTSDLMPDAAEGACGTGGNAGKTSNPHYSIGEGETFSWSVSVLSPNGAVEVTNAVVIDRIPDDIDFVSASAGVPAEFTVYYCVVPGVTDNFTQAEFLNTHQASSCSTSAPGNLASVTHVVWHAPVWGDASVGITPFSGSMQVKSAVGVFNNDDEVINTARAEGQFDVGGPQTYLFEPADPIRIRTGAIIRMETAFHPASERFKLRSPGEEFTVYGWSGSNWGSARVRNPTVTMQIPEGLEVVSIDPPDFDGGSGGCAWEQPLPTIFSDPPSSQVFPDGSTELVWTFGDGSQPSLMPFTCVSINGGGYSGSVPLWLPVRLRVSETVPMVNNQQLQVISFGSGENAVESFHVPLNINVAVPAEMRTDVQPDCSEESEPEPSLLISYENSGGEQLTNVAVTVAIPKLADGSGTQVDTDFKRIENAPIGVSFEYEVGGSWTSSLPGNLSTVTSVRAVAGTLATATGPQTFNVVLAVPSGTPTGTFIRGSSLMASDELLEVASAASAPIKVDLCPGILAVHVFFDANGNGTQDTDEPDLPGWNVITDDTADASVSLTWTTDGNGDYGQQVAPSTYEMAATHPTTGPGATWTSGPVQASVETNQTTYAVIPVTCECADDGDVCTSEVCNAQGQCEYGSVGGDDGIIDDCDGEDNDCDGETDEDFVAEPSDCGEGICVSSGVTTCNDGVLEDDCTPGAPVGGPDICDGEDTDCDGDTDEDFAGVATSCGVGYCAADGMTACVAGVESDTCEPGDPNPAGELCNNQDDDCDGQVDTAADGSEPCGTTDPVGTPLDVCIQHPLNGAGSAVFTTYTNINQPLRFCHRFDGTDATTPFPGADGCSDEPVEQK